MKQVLRHSKRRVATILAAVSLLFASGAGPAAAHPHVWIDSTTRIVFNAQQEIEALEIEWRFDEFYSLFAIEGLDTNGDGLLQEAELQELAKVNITSLKDYSYFTYLTVDGVEAAFGDVEEYASRFEDGILSLRFLLPVAQGVDPRRNAISLTSYDPSFYVSIEPLGETPVALSGGAPSGCAVDLTRGGETETLNFSDLDLLNAGSQSLAAQFASRASINCLAAVVSQ